MNLGTAFVLIFGVLAAIATGIPFWLWPEAKTMWAGCIGIVLIVGLIVAWREG